MQHHLIFPSRTDILDARMTSFHDFSCHADVWLDHCNPGHMFRVTVVCRMILSLLRVRSACCTLSLGNGPVIPSKYQCEMGQLSSYSILIQISKLSSHMCNLQTTFKKWCMMSYATLSPVYYVLIVIL